MADPFPKVEAHINAWLEPSAFDVTRHASAPPDRITPYQMKVLRRLTVPAVHVGVTSVYGVRGGFVAMPEIFINEQGEIGKVRGDALDSLLGASCLELAGWDHWVTRFEISDIGRLVLKRADRAFARLLRTARKGAANG